MSVGTYHQQEVNESVNSAKAKILSFDDIDTTPYGSAVVSNGYAKLDWSNMYVINKTTSGIDYYGNSGYITGVTSGDQAAFTGFGSPASVYIADGTFTFNSVEMTSGWNTSEKVDITGYDSAGNVIHDKVVKITDANATLIELNWKGVSEITFTPLSGKADPNLTGSGLHVVFDDMVVSKVKGTAAIAPSQHTVLDAHAAFGAATHGHVDAPSFGHDLYAPTHLVLA